VSLALVRELQAAGGEIIQKDGHWVIRGDPPEELLARIRQNREAVIEAWDEDLRSRYDRAPAGEVRLRAKAPVWRDEVRARVTRFVESQNGEVTAWMAKRMADYLGAGMSGRDAQAAAMLDLMQFQLARQVARGEDPAEYLTLLN
jgi:hypothetical protein